jgi:Mg2+ and Co2+ transporter CorA
MDIKEIKKAIEHLENQIEKSHIINERDLNHLNNLEKLYIYELNKLNEPIVIDDVGQVYNPEKI